MRTSNNSTKIAALAVAPLLVLVITIITTSALSQHAMAQQPNSDKPFAVGAITTLQGEHVSFAAHTNPKGGYSGHVVMDIAGYGTDSGPVSCFMPTSANSALISFDVKNGPGTGNTRTIMVVDNGEPMGNGLGPDMYSNCGIENPCSVQYGCSSETIIRGNIVVGH